MSNISAARRAVDTGVPYRNIDIAFALVVVAAGLAFGKSYSAGITFSGRSVTPLVHIHGGLMLLWLLLLITQAWLVRTRRLRVHRLLGRSSFVVVPVIIVMTLLVDHESLQTPTGRISADTAQIEVYSWGQVVGLAMAWGLAMRYRRRTPIHVRYIISTVFAIGSAIVFRLILSWFLWVPGMDSIDQVAAANGIVLALPLLALIALDRRLGVKRSPFWVILMVIVLTNVGYFTFAKSDLWFGFVQWFTRL